MVAGEANLELGGFPVKDLIHQAAGVGGGGLEGSAFVMP